MSFKVKNGVEREKAERDRQTRAILIGGETKGSIREEIEGTRGETIAD